MCAEAAPEPVVQEFAPPGNGALICRGRPCANCGNCRDWYYNGDLESWRWIQTRPNWTAGDNNWLRWDNGHYWEFFIKRADGATCVSRGDCPYYAGGGYYGHRSYGHSPRGFFFGFVRCLCDDNRRN